MSDIIKDSEEILLVIRLTDNFTNILTREVIKKYPILNWSNGLGDRWIEKKLNYTVIYSSKITRLYSENLGDKIPIDILNQFFKTNNKKTNGIIAIFVHSRRINKEPERPISNNIHKLITSLSCVICGKHETVCDHKNDLYNDSRVLNIKTQVILVIYKKEAFALKKNLPENYIPLKIFPDLIFINIHLTKTILLVKFTHIGMTLFYLN